VQPAGNATISGPLRRGADHPEAVECTTRISGLQVPSLIDGERAFAAVRATGGKGHVVGDEETWAVQGRLAREEGIFAEPAGTVPTAGFLRAAAEGLIRPDAVVVCLATGSGFKDAAALDRLVADRECPLLTPEEVMRE
jgi:threonine synthase